MDLSLNRIGRLVSALPKYSRPTFHVAGTNGKGSVTVLLDSMLRQAGYTTGRFNSPHLITTRDSISINGCTIPGPTYDDARTAVAKADEEIECHASSFERLTTTALYAFEEAQVDVVILEVGLGGRLDATNIISNDVVVACGIAAIDLDHQAILGNSVEEIAREKAGIAKQGVPCVVGAQAHSSTLKVLQETIEAAGGEFLLALPTKPTSSSSEEGYRFASPAPKETSIPPPAQNIVIQTRKTTFEAKLNLAGDHQLANVSLAVGMLEAAFERGYFTRVSDTEMSKGIEEARWLGRLDWIRLPTMDRYILVDGAHNQASATALAHYLKSVKAPLQFVISLSHSPPKTPFHVLRPLLSRGDNVAVVPFTPVEGMPWVKPVESSDVAEVARDLVADEGTVETFDCLEDALKAVRNKERTIVVSGSLYLVSDLYRLLRRDSDRA